MNTDWHEVQVTPALTSQGFYDFAVSNQRYVWLTHHVGFRGEAWDHPTEDVYRFKHASDATVFALQFT